MKVIKFRLEGRFGFFKKPDVNTYVYFTYGNIHKIALLGIFGAILGYKGYNEMAFKKKYKKQFKGFFQNIEELYPEFYEKLKDLKIAIEPNKVSINKKIQIFNNSVGYASKEKGGNLIVKEQWLENPSWNIYIVVQGEEARKIKEALINRSFTYMPYLGKNDHLADIKDVQLISEVEEINEPCSVQSLFIKEDFQLVENGNFDEFHEFHKLDNEKVSIFKYEEKLPISLEETTNKYELKSFVYTNSNLKKQGNVSVYNVCGKNIVFI